MEILDIAIKWAIPTILAGIFAHITKELKDNRSNNDAMHNSMVLLLRSQIVGKCETYLELGYLPTYARSCLDDLFKQYTALGGNHGVGTLVEQCFNLPPMKKEGKV